MRERRVMTQRIGASEAKQHFGQVLKKVFGGEIRIVVEKNGLPVAGIISAQDLERLGRLEEQQQKDYRIFDEIGEAFEDVPQEEIEREVARALVSLRKKYRSQRERVARAS